MSGPHDSITSVAEKGATTHDVVSGPPVTVGYGQRNIDEMIIVSWACAISDICADPQDESLVQAEREDRMTPYLVFLISAAALGGFLYGYDTGIIGVALPYVGDDLGHFLSDQEQEITTAACTIGSILGAAIIGYFADAWGRKWCLAIADVL